MADQMTLAELLKQYYGEAQPLTFDDLAQPPDPQTLPALNAQQHYLENDYSKPGPPRVQTETAGTLSPTMGGYSLGQLLAESYEKGSEGDWGGVADRLPMLAPAIFGFGRARAKVPLGERAIDAEPVAAAERWENRPTSDQRVIDTAKARGMWPQWADEYPDRALASSKEQLAASAWNDVVEPIQFPNGLRAMERWEAEAQAMKTHPDLGIAAQEAKQAWLEHDKGRPLTPGELVWHGLDRPPGAPPPSGKELMHTIGRERFMLQGSPPPRGAPPPKLGSK